MYKIAHGAAPIHYGFALLFLISSCSFLAEPVFVPGQVRDAGDYYVDGVNGSDLSPGTAARPWRTIQTAAEVVPAGSTVHVRAGRYDERVRITAPGSAEAPIVFQAEGNVRLKGFTVLADYVAVRGFRISDTPDVWDDGVGIFVSANFCQIEDNVIHDATRGGILLFAEDESAGPEGCVVRNNRLSRNGLVGIEIHGRDHLVEGNEIWATIQYHPNWKNPPRWVDADGIRFFGRGHVLRRNYIHDITYAVKENRNPHIDCFQTWGPAQDIVLEQNRCQAPEYQGPNEQGKGFMIESRDGPAENLIIRNNLVVAFNHVTVVKGRRIEIVNNTFVSDLGFDSTAQVGVALFRSPSVTVKNNIFYDLPSPHLAVDAGSRFRLDAGYNAIYRSDGSRPEGRQLPGDLWGVDPRFVDPAAGDFRLRVASPAIDTGAKVDVSDDLSGERRPLGDGYDMGAYEFAIADADVEDEPRGMK